MNNILKVLWSKRLGVFVTGLIATWLSSRFGVTEAESQIVLMGLWNAVGLTLTKWWDERAKTKT